MPRTPETRRADVDAARPIVTQLLLARTAANHTQAGLAAHLGCNRNQIHKWEYGISTPSIGWLAGWAAALGYDLALIPRDTATEG